MAHYYLGDYVDSHTAQECRAEAVRRAFERGQQVDPVLAHVSAQLAEARAYLLVQGDVIERARELLGAREDESLVDAVRRVVGDE